MIGAIIKPQTFFKLSNLDSNPCGCLFWMRFKNVTLPLFTSTNAQVFFKTEHSPILERGDSSFILWNSNVTKVRRVHCVTLNDVVT